MANIRIKILLLLMSVVCSVVFAQNKIDPLDSGSIDIKINQLLLDSDTIRSSHPDKLNQNIAKLRSLQASFNDIQQDFFDFLVIYQIGFTGDYDKTKVELSALYNRSQDLRVKIRSKVLLANLLVISRDYQESISSLDYALEKIEQLNDKTTKHFVYNTAAIIYRLVQQNELSLKFSGLILDDQPSDEYLCKATSNKYRIMLASDYQGLFEQEIQEAIKLCESIGDYVYSNLLKLDWLDHKLLIAGSDRDLINEVLALLLDVKEEVISAQYKNLISIWYGMLAKTYWQLDSGVNALKYAILSLNESESIGNTRQQIESLQIMVAYYQNIGDYKTANEYLVRKHFSEKTQYDDQKEKLMAFQIVKHNDLAKGQEIDLLSQKNHLLSLEKKLAAKTAENDQLLILFLVTITVFFLFWGFKTKRQQLSYKRKSLRDHMTRIYNRKGLEDHVSYLLSYSQRRKKQLGFAIFDLDNFKKINDQYGHATGDWVIENVINVCKKLENPKVVFGRLGGEEFAVIMKDTHIEEVTAFLEKCCEAIYKLNTAQSGFVFSVTASFGVTSSEISGYNYTDLMANADEAMYQAKQKGRNQVVIYRAENLNYKNDLKTMSQVVSSTINKTTLEPRTDSSIN